MWSRMWDRTIPTVGSHFQVRNEASRVSDQRNCEWSHLTRLTTADYFSHINLQLIRYLCLTFKLCSLMKNEHAIWKIIVCVSVLYLRYKTVTKSYQTVVYRFKTFWVQSLLMTRSKWFDFATFPHCEAYKW